jgi:RNA polymerase sigma factor (sigma-70 family)
LALEYSSKIVQPMDLSKPANPQEESLLWQRFKAGEETAFAQLYQLHIQALLSYGQKITADRSLLHDAIHDLFVELWESRERIADVASVRYYLLKSLRYKLLRNLGNKTFVDLDKLDPIGSETTIDQELLQVEDAQLRTQQLEKALTQLPKRQQEAIHLRYFQNLSNEEVAQIMGVNYQSACKFIYTALKTLKDILRQYQHLLPFFFFWQNF